MKWRLKSLMIKIGILTANLKELIAMKTFATAFQKCPDWRAPTLVRSWNYGRISRFSAWLINCSLQRSMKFLVFSFSILFLFDFAPLRAQLSLEASLDQARRLYERISSLPPSDAEVAQMAQLIAEGKTDQAAFIAMNNNGFYTLTLRNMFAPLSNADKLLDIPLTDFTATVAGLVRDNEEFHQILHADVIYTANDEAQTYTQIFTIDGQPVTFSSNTPERPLRRTDGVFNRGNNSGLPPSGKVRPIIRSDGRYRDNLHYSDLEYNFSSNWVEVLQKRTQSETIYSANYIDRGNERVPSMDIAGLLTTRQFAGAAYTGGTNRRPYAMLMENFMCNNLESVHNPNLPDTWVRQDIDRSPAGDDMAFQTQCAGCHTHMDAASGAFVFFDFRGDRTFWNSPNLNNPGNKIFRLAGLYPAGHRPTNNSWQNLLRFGPNARLGFRQINGVQSLDRGAGLKSFGLLMASTEAFSECMVEKTFEKVCFRNFKAEATPNEKAIAEQIAREFEAGVEAYASYGAAGAYNLKSIFAKVSNLCFGNE